MVTEEIELAMEDEDQEGEEEGIRDGKLSQCLNESEAKPSASAVAELCRKVRRKALKKEKRKQKRKEAAEKSRQEEDARLNDPEEQRRIELEEEREKERLERERREFEEKERLFLEALARRKAQEEEEEEERRRAKEAEKLNENQVEGEMEANEDDEWDYIEEGPPEIIWQGNEIIVKKNKVRVKKKVAEQQIGKEDADRPTSNPLLPQSEAFAHFKNAPMISAQQLLENVAQQVPNFGTEQDKAHCPFHLKTGACRFGSRCSRVHFYPDKSCTLLIKNMYNGPGLAWEQDEGLEYTDEEVERSYEEFYEDVHTEFLKFGEIVNFKVCRNGSHHLRGNVYVHYVSLDAAVLAYHAINGRYFAGKQVSCEFVGVTKWRVAICGEYMKSKLKTCSRGTACNFIHCFRNPGGDYDWADWDKPAPKYWVRKMAALFGYSHEYEKRFEQENPGHHGNSSKRLTTNAERYHSRRSQSTERKSFKKSPRDHYEKDESRSSKHWKRNTSDDATRPEVPHERQYNVERYSTSHGHEKKRQRLNDSESDRDWLDKYHDADRFHDRTREKTSRHHHYGRWESLDVRETRRSGSLDTLSDSDLSDRGMDIEKHHEYPKKRSRKQKVISGSGDNSDYSTKERFYSTDSSREQSYENRKSLSSKDHLHRKRRTSGIDSTGDSSDGITQSSHGRRRKSQTHRKEVSGLSMDHQDSRKSSLDKHHLRESDHSKSNPQTGQTQSSSGKVEVDRFHSSRKTANFDDPDEQDENMDTRGILQPVSVDEREAHKQRRKSHGKPRSHNQNNEHSKESRSRARSKSRPSKHKRRTSSRQVDSNED